MSTQDSKNFGPAGLRFLIPYTFYFVCWLLSEEQDTWIFRKNFFLDVVVFGNFFYRFGRVGERVPPLVPVDFLYHGWAGVAIRPHGTRGIGRIFYPPGGLPREMPRGIGAPKGRPAPRRGARAPKKQAASVENFF